VVPLGAAGEKLGTLSGTNAGSRPVGENTESPGQKETRGFVGGSWRSGSAAVRTPKILKQVTSLPLGMELLKKKWGISKNSATKGKKYWVGWPCLNEGGNQKSKGGERKTPGKMVRVSGGKLKAHKAAKASQGGVAKFSEE